MPQGCAMQQVDAGERRVVCPKPRRLSVLPFQPAEGSDPKPVKDLLAMLLPKQPDPCPPFLCGSPPRRYNNPVVHDARFGEVVPIGSVPVEPAVNGSGSASRAAFALVRYGLAPAAVRVEGFDHNRGIPAVA
ncbi:hypothetical protein HPP92_019709 [Vanilla planifolia]|uniref:Uncharacterized protein n=1 Tax=Vanilla planifolia TaxID=51239 RepID=A0A835Q3C9_VANPL|nr:hypothetical protein HPP92_019709 [Vanilla planifolia]